MTNAKITLHWLNQSRTQRILWLLEELEVPYNIKVWFRTEKNRAPPELKEVHPLGKAPVVDVEIDGKKKTLAESGFITEYLIKHFDEKKLLTPTCEDAEDVSYYCHLAEGSLQPPMTMFIILALGARMSPWFFRPLMNTVCSSIVGMFTVPEVTSILDFLESTLEKKTGDKRYFVGEKPSGADIMLYFHIVDEAMGMQTLKNYFPVEKYPRLTQWIKDVESRPAFKKAAAIQKEYDDKNPNKFTIQSL